MLIPTATSLRPSAVSLHSSGNYFLSDVKLDITSWDTAIFHARLHGPVGSKVWVRAWLSNEIEGTLAEAASDCLEAGALTTLTLKLKDARIPKIACIRIESAPLATEQVVIMTLPDKA